MNINEMTDFTVISKVPLEINEKALDRWLTRGLWGLLSDFQPWLTIFYSEHYKTFERRRKEGRKEGKTKEEKKEDWVKKPHLPTT